MYLQMSFLPPPFGGALFYLKGGAPPEVSLGDIMAALHFLPLQVIGLVITVAFPALSLWLLGLMIK